MSCSIELVSRSVHQATPRAPDANVPTGSFADLHAKALDRAARDRLDVAEPGGVRAITDVNLQRHSPDEAASDVNLSGHFPGGVASDVNLGRANVDAVSDVNLPRHDLDDALSDVNLGRANVDAVSDVNLGRANVDAVSDVNLPRHDLDDALSDVNLGRANVDAAGPGDITPRLSAILDEAESGDVQPVANLDRQLPAAPATYTPSASALDAAPATRGHSRDSGGVTAPDTESRPRAGGAPTDTGGVSAPPASSATTRRGRTSD